MNQLTNDDRLGKDISLKPKKMETVLASATI
jgi:hypothetical protein